MADRMPVKTATHQSQRQADGPLPEISLQPAPASPYAAILGLQRAAGNRAVSQLLQPEAVDGPRVQRTCAACPAGGSQCADCREENEGQVLQRAMIAPGAFLQARLNVSQPQDAHEQEADRVADQVMRGPDAQRAPACGCGGECPKCQAEQRGQGHRPVQTKRVQAAEAGEAAAPPIVHAALRTPGQGLHPATRTSMERRFGYDFSHVRVHTDARAAESAREVNALAYTVGRDIVFGAGQYAPQAPTGKTLLAHELTHVVQQGQATAAPNQVASTSHESAEGEAEVSGTTMSHLPATVTPGAGSTALLQRKTDPFELLGTAGRTIGKGMSAAGEFLKTQVRRGVKATSELIEPEEDRETLVKMVDDPASAHEQWKKISPGGRRAILTAMRKKYGEDWADEFMTRQESGAVKPGFFAYGRAPGIEELRDQGFALASAFQMTTESRFERWVHPNGSTAQMVREIRKEEPLEEPPSASELLPAEEPAREEDEEEAPVDLPREEIVELSGVEIPEEEFVGSEIVRETEDGKRTIKVTTTKFTMTLSCRPDDTCTTMIEVQEE